MGIFKRNSGAAAARLILALASFLVVAGLVYWSVGYLVLSFTTEETDDAFLDGHVVSIAPKIAGQVSAVHVMHNDDVKKGDLLVEIDPRDWEAQLAVRRASLAGTEANKGLVETSYQLMQTRVETAELTARQAQADQAAAQASADRAKADFQRGKDLLAQQIISQADFDAANAAAISAEAALRSATEKVATETSRVKEAKGQLAAAKSAYEQAVAQVAQSHAEIHSTELSLSYAKIFAPQAGRITRKNVEPGSYVQVGQPLMMIVETNLWVTANFKETQLASIRPGQKVRIEIDSVPDRIFTGKVDSFQAGSGARFSLLPPENAVGNYVKVVQRVPVKILFTGDARAEHILGPGMSVSPTVIISDFDLPLIARLAIALVVAAIVVWAGGRIFAKKSEAKARANGAAKTPATAAAA
jgi:membrane fusion protein (multidrug efflux system)